MRTKEEIRKNFVGVLHEYSEYDNISYQGDMILELIENDVIDSYNDIFEMGLGEEVTDYLNESVEEKPVLSDIQIVEEELGKGLSLKINDIEFRYVSDKFSVTELRHKLLGLMRAGVNESIKWLKENAVNYWNGWQIQTQDEKLAENNEEKEIEDGNESKEEEIKENKSLDKKVKEWEVRLKEEDLLDKVHLSLVSEGNGLFITVFEDEEGNIHEDNSVLEDIKEYVQGFDDEVDITENWSFDEGIEDDVDVWYTSFVFERDKDGGKGKSEEVNEAEEEDGTEDDFAEEIEDTEEFKKKIKESMDSVNISDDSFSVSYSDFKVSGDNYVDIVFEGNINNEDVSESNVEEFLQSGDIVDSVIEKMSDVVDDYESTFLEFGELDIDIDAENIKIMFEFKVVDDTGDDGEQDVETNESKKKVEEAKAGNLRGSINSDSQLASFDVDEFGKNGGNKLFGFLDRKGLLRKDVFDYTRVDIFPGNEIGEVIFSFIFESLGFEQEDNLRVEVNLIKNISSKLYDFLDREIGIEQL